ncbi:MAG: MBL fold metallo-hydrolase [Eubacterium sp.]|nr:MBL fold metallo-hydrolase [Candidatus Colimonas fimequi]
MGIETIKVNENTWRFEEHGMVRFFLLTGSDKALLIDGGMQPKDAVSIVRELTDLPLEHLVTHADPDHLGACHQFEEFYMHAAEASNFYNTQKREGNFVSVEDGQIIDLGGRPLEIVLLPGHTPGSIGLIDINARTLYGGDIVQDGRIFMFGVQREIHAYMQSMKRLMSMKERFDIVYPSHSTFPVGTDLIDALYEAAGRIINDEFPKFDVDMHGMKAKMVDVGVAKFLVD